MGPLATTWRLWPVSQSQGRVLSGSLCLLALLWSSAESAMATSTSCTPRLMHPRANPGSMRSPGEMSVWRFCQCSVQPTLCHPSVQACDAFVSADFQACPGSAYNVTDIATHSLSGHSICRNDDDALPSCSALQTQAYPERLQHAADGNVLGCFGHRAL